MKCSTCKFWSRRAILTIQNKKETFQTVVEKSTYLDVIEEFESLKKLEESSFGNCHNKSIFGYRQSGDIGEEYINNDTITDITFKDNKSSLIILNIDSSYINHCITGEDFGCRHHKPVPTDMN